MIFLLWPVLSLLVAGVASNRGRSAWVFLFLSLVLSPLVGLLVLLAVGRDEERLSARKLASGEAKRCPHCAEVVRAEAVVCPHCQRSLDGVNAAESFGHALSTTIASTLRLAVCGALILGAGFTVLHYSEQSAEKETLEGPSATSPSRGPATVTPPAIENEAQGQQLAVAEFPQLAVAGSPLHREFLARHKARKAAEPAFFADPRWPLTLAREADAAIRSTASARR